MSDIQGRKRWVSLKISKKTAMQKSILTITGFLLFLFGFLALVLSAIGLQFAWLVWIDKIGPTFGFLCKLGMILAGIILVVIAQTDWDRERAESQ